MAHRTPSGFNYVPRLVGRVFDLPNYWLRDGTRRLAWSNSDAHCVRNNAPRDFLMGSHSSVVFHFTNATADGIAHFACRILAEVRALLCEASTNG
jgi:hypothetical protein